MSQPQPEPQVSPVAEPAQPAQPSEAGPSTAPTHPATHEPRTTTTTGTTPAPATTRADNAPTHPAITQTSTASTLVTNNNEPQTFYDKLNAGDRGWKWKIGMRAIIVLVSFIGLGCAAWIVANFTSQARYRYFDMDNWDYDIFPWVLITFSISIVWGAVCGLVFLMKKSHAPVHPGAQVAVDLILWLSYIGTALCAVAGALSVSQLGNDGTIGGSYWSSGSDRWDYHQSNNSWVYNASSSYDRYSSSSSSSNGRSCNGSSSSSSSYRYSSYYGEYPFANCQDLDEYVNTLWQTKGARFNSELTATVCQFIALLLHFVLFVWACVDTHRRRRGKVGKDAEKLAAEIVQKMITNGAIIPPPGQAHVRPMAPPQQQFYPQQYPQYQQYQQFAPQPPPQASQALPANAQAPPPSSGRIPPHEQSTLVSQTRSEKAPRFA